MPGTGGSSGSRGGTAADLGIPGLENAERIGSGGFGDVYRAHQPALSRVVAVKLLREAFDDPGFNERVEREARAMGVVSSHPNIVTVFGSGFLASGQAWLLMDYQPGGSLADRLAAQGPLPWREVLALGVKLAGALETAHRSGVLHRDVKPANVLVSRYGEPQLADFGIARTTDADATATAGLTGSVDHMAPELVAGHRASAASDVYALGSTLHTLLAGLPPHRRHADDPVVAVIARMGTEPPADLRARGVPDIVATVIERLLARDTGERPGTAAAAGRVLQEAQRAAGLDATPMAIVGEAPPSASGAYRRPTGPVPIAAPHPSDPFSATPSGPVAATPHPSGPVVAPTPHPSGPLPVEHERPPAAVRRRGVLVAVVAALVVLAGLGAVLATRGGGEPQVAGGDPQAAATGAGPSQAPPATAPATAVATAPTSDPTAAPTATTSALEAALLTAADLPGGAWATDDQLVASWRTNPGFRLCGPGFGDAVATELALIAFRQQGPGVPAQVGHGLIRFAPGQAAAFTAVVREQPDALSGTCRFNDVVLEELALDADEAFLIRYGADRAVVDGVVTTTLVFVRSGDTVAEVIAIVPPGQEVAAVLTEDLLAVVEQGLQGV